MNVTIPRGHHEVDELCFSKVHISICPLESRRGYAGGSI